MTKRIAVIEPPFIEPGMPYPEIVNVADLLNCAGAMAIPVDINIRLFRSILAEPFGGSISWEKLISAVADAFFIDHDKLKNHIINKYGSLDDISEALSNALRDKDILKIEALKQDAMNRFDGSGKYINHYQYIRDIELFNVLLGYKIKQIDADANLSMDNYDNNINIQSSKAILKYLKKRDNGLILLYEKYLANELSSWNYDDIIIIITNQTQLVPGLVLASWMKNKLKLKVTLNGSYIDDVFKLHIPGELFEHLDAIIAYRIDYSANYWLKQLQHNYIISHPIHSYPDFRQSNNQKVIYFSRTFPVSNLELYFTPLPIIGASVSSRCYWSKCKFCAVSCQDKYPFKYQKSETTLEIVKKHQKDYGVNHVQFLDYALPPAFLKRFCHSKNLNVFWSCQTRFEKSFLEEGFFQRLFSSGCTSISWGFETGSEKILKLMNKGGEINKLSRQKILKASFEAGIINHLFVITGLPYETDDDFLETVYFLYENINVISGIEVYPFQLHPHTAIGRNPFRYGFKTQEKSDDWCMDIPFTGEPDKKTAIKRAKYLKDTFGFVSKQSKTNDYLEGHLTFSRRFKETVSYGRI